MELDIYKINCIMAKKQMTQSQLARIMGKRRQQISQFFFRQRCSTINVGKIASALGVEPEEITKEPSGRLW